MNDSTPDASETHTNNTQTGETHAVRASEQLDWIRLAHYLRAHIVDVAWNAEMTVEQFGGGHSNLTYLLRFMRDERVKEFVLRRPPFGRLPPRAHDMVREYRFLARLNPVFPLAPRPVLLCEDASIAGATFYLMERRRGVVIRDCEPPQIAGRTEMRRAVSCAVVDALSALHRVDVRAHGLEDLGKPAGFVARQVTGWTERWRRAQTSHVAEMEQVAAWLHKRLPVDATLPTLVHGDFKLDNVMLDEGDLSRVVAVFDWEMSAIGDPLIDLGILLSYWTHAAAAIGEASASGGVTHLPGWLTRDEIIERYGAQSGRDVSGIEFYELFAVFKLAVVAQQIFYRFRHKQTDGARFASFEKYVSALARRAATLANA